MKGLARSYLALNRDTTRVMNRLKALYWSWAIPCAGQKVYAPRYRNQWLAKITEAGVRRRAEFPIEPWLAPDHRSALLVSELTGFIANSR